MRSSCRAHTTRSLLRRRRRIRYVKHILAACGLRLSVANVYLSIATWSCLPVNSRTAPLCCGRLYKRVDLLGESPARPHISHSSHIPISSVNINFITTEYVVICWFKNYKEMLSLDVSLHLWPNEKVIHILCRRCRHCRCRNCHPRWTEWSRPASHRLRHSWPMFTSLFKIQNVYSPQK